MVYFLHGSLILPSSSQEQKEAEKLGAEQARANKLKEKEDAKAAAEAKKKAPPKAGKKGAGDGNDKKEGEQGTRTP